MWPFMRAFNELVFDGIVADVIDLARGERHQQMQMVGEQYDGVEGEGVVLLAVCDGLAEEIAGPCVGKDGGAVLGDEREEERTAGLDAPSVVRHGSSVPLGRCGRQIGIVRHVVGEYTHPTSTS